MTERKARSRSALPQQRCWSSSTGATFSSSKEPKNYHKHINYLKASQAKVQLPPARGIQQGRTEKGFVFYPCQVQNLAKPARPLSGCVFLRRSSKHGWVAKAYPQTSSNYSQPDLLSSMSTDSFFDDDFEEESVEKLGSLLSCDKLGVDTKAVKHDWVSGEVNIPKFHCPRCRDHWYKFSSLPCDEELARLIKEGLWYTGNKPKGDRNLPKQNKFIPMESQTTIKERQGSAHLSSSHRDKLLKQKHDMNNRKAGTSGSEWSREDDEEIKRKQMITFQLQESIREGSSADDKLLSNSKQTFSGEQQPQSCGGGSGHGKDDDATSSGGTRVSRGEGRVGDWGGGTGTGEGGDYGAEVGIGVVSNDRLGATLLQDLKISTSNLRNSEREDLNNKDKNKTAKRSHEQFSEGEHARDMSQEERRGKTSDTLINHERVGSVSSEMNSTDDGCGSGSNTHQHVLKPSSNDILDYAGFGSGNLGGDQTIGNNKSKKSEASSGDGSVAVHSPPFSKWEADLHARSFISSSVHSHSGSISLGKSDGNGENAFLQPLVPRIIGPPPQHDLLCWRPNITRAWTFSYFNPT